MTNEFFNPQRKQTLVSVQKRYTMTPDELPYRLRNKKIYILHSSITTADVANGMKSCLALMETVEAIANYTTDYIVREAMVKLKEHYAPNVYRDFFAKDVDNIQTNIKYWMRLAGELLQTDRGEELKTAYWDFITDRMGDLQGDLDMLRQQIVFVLNKQKKHNDKVELISYWVMASYCFALSHGGAKHCIEYLKEQYQCNFEPVFRETDLQKKCENYINAILKRLLSPEDFNAIAYDRNVKNAMIILSNKVYDYNALFKYMADIMEEHKSIFTKAERRDMKLSANKIEHLNDK